MRLALEITLMQKLEVSFPGDSPLEVKVKVVNLSMKFKMQGAFYKGFQMELGKSALLEIEPRIFVVVSSSKPQMADRELYKFVGVNPEKMRILVNKSSVHFRADFEPIAKKLSLQNLMVQCQQIWMN